jgi:hypothetical protein
MPYTEEEFKIEVDGVSFELKKARKNLPDFSRRHFNRIRENALIFCLKRAADLAEACLILKDHKLADPIGVLTRAIFDCLLWTLWTVKSDDHAQLFSNYAKEQSLRNIKKNLRTGYGKVFERATGKDVSKDFLESQMMKGVSGVLKVEDIAKEVGLQKIHTQMYGALSMEGHGSIYNFMDNEAPEDRIFMFLAATNSFFEVINLVVENWIIHRKQTPVDEILQIVDPD